MTTPIMTAVIAEVAQRARFEPGAKFPNMPLLERIGEGCYAIDYLADIRIATNGTNGSFYVTAFFRPVEHFRTFWAAYRRAVEMAHEYHAKSLCGLPIQTVGYAYNTSLNANIVTIRTALTEVGEACAELDQIEAAEEAGREAFKSISGRMSDGKGFDYPKCPYRRTERAAAWQRGFDEMRGAFDDAMSEAA